MKPFRQMFSIVITFSLLTFGFFTSAANAATVVSGGATETTSIMESCRASFFGDTVANSVGHRIEYATVGSGTGRANFFKNDYVFAMSGSIWRPSEITNAQATSGGAARTTSNFVHFPMISIPIGVIYNLEGVKPAGTAIKMSSATVAKVFAGQITKWNDPAIIAENPPITRANPATTLSAKPEISEYGKYKVTLAKTKYQNKARLTVDLDPNFIMKNSKNLVVTYSTATRGATIKKIFDKKPKSGKLVVNVPYQFGTTYTIKLNKKTLGTVSVDARSVPNPDSKVNIELPDTAITVYKRKDTNATTNSFANYLNKTQPTIWYKSSNDAFDSAFPGTVPTDGTFVAAQGNDDLLNGIASKNGAIGYAELPYINERSNSGNPVSVVEIKNGAGEFVPVSATGVKLALSAAAIDANTGVITQNFETTISGAYPITAVIYGLANTTGVGTLQNNSIVKNFVEYFLSTCASRVAKTKGYVDLPDNILNVSKATAARIAS